MEMQPGRNAIAPPVRPLLNAEKGPLLGLEKVVNSISVVMACRDAMMKQVCRVWDKQSRSQDEAVVVKAKKIGIGMRYREAWLRQTMASIMGDCSFIVRAYT
jgi:GTP cyclohydrolase I